MIVRSALMISTPTDDDQEIADLVATSDEFLQLREVLNNPKIGGFGRITSLADSDCAKGKTEISRFFQNRESHEVLLLYLNGFELINVEDRIYFTDKNSDTGNLEETTISARFIHDAMKDCGAKQKILIIDCFSRHEMDAKRKDEKEARLVRFSRATKSFVLTSQDTIGTAKTAEGIKNPKFTASLVEGLRTGDADLDRRGYITEDELFLYIYKRMNEHGVTPNLYLTSSNENKRIRIATNIQFSDIPVYAQEDSAIDFGRFFRLVKKRKDASEIEKNSLNKVIRRQPEIIFIKRLGKALLTGVIAGSLAGVLTSVPVYKSILIAVIVLVAIVAEGLISRAVSS